LGGLGGLGANSDIQTAGRRGREGYAKDAKGIPKECVIKLLMAILFGRGLD
jgi:hypothetical protein